MLPLGFSLRSAPGFPLVQGQESLEFPGKRDLRETLSGRRCPGQLAPSPRPQAEQKPASGLGEASGNIKDQGRLLPCRQPRRLPGRGSALLRGLSPGLCRHACLQARHPHCSQRQALPRRARRRLRRCPQIPHPHLCSYPVLRGRPQYPEPHQRSHLGAYLKPSPHRSQGVALADMVHGLFERFPQRHPCRGKAPWARRRHLRTHPPGFPAGMRRHALRQLRLLDRALPRPA